MAQAYGAELVLVKRAWKRRETSPWPCRRGGRGWSRLGFNTCQPGMPLPPTGPESGARAAGRSPLVCHETTGTIARGLYLATGGGEGNRPG